MVYKVKRSFGDGLPLPAPGTVVIYNGKNLTYGDIKAGTRVFVCREATRDDEKDKALVVSTRNYQKEGYYCNEWYEEHESPLALLNLTEDQKKFIATQAEEVSKKLGYCDEAKKVIRELGLNTVPTRKVIVELEVAEDGSKFNIDNLKYESGTKCVKVVSTKVVDNTSDEW